ncbi:MAG: hypothetical protein CVU90_02650 [Firmicutes bacterium HGW-Firmicutes-15]|nr:MAG: hypothetical protein CVU90_02650 [Firmicutes bacterium HGW-Firmicutes-15]
MNNLEFIKKLYNGKNCYSDPMTQEELDLLHIESATEQLIESFIVNMKVVFLTGNPGDGKTYIIKTLKKVIEENNAYVVTDINSEPEMNRIAVDIVECYMTKRACIIAVNEYPFLLLLKEIKHVSKDLYDEIQALKKFSVIYNTARTNLNGVVIVDLNNRSLLDTDRELPVTILNRLLELAKSSSGLYKELDSTITSLSDEYIQKQLSQIISLVDLSGEHFAMRDILGAMAFMLTSCINTDEDIRFKYYDAMFNGNNELLEFFRNFDPLYLSSPEQDEKLWNGECLEGWRQGLPLKWPYELEDQDEAMACFRSIKRRFYFENINSIYLNELVPIEIQKTNDVFHSLDNKKEKIKKDIIESLNKLYLPSDETRDKLRIWTIHSYDLSRDASATVSSRFIDSSLLELSIPSQPDWLKRMEYTPTHLVLKPKNKTFPKLIIDIDFMRALFIVKDGYPIELLSPRYEQAATVFINSLDDIGYTEANDNGEIIIADRRKSHKKVISILEGKYAFEEVDS